MLTELQVKNAKPRETEYKLPDSPNCLQSRSFASEGRAQDIPAKETPEQS